MQKISVVARLKAKVGQEERVKKELLLLVALTRKETGCLNYDLHVDSNDPGRFVFYENWVSLMALANHLESEHIARLHSMEEQLFAEPAEINLLTMITEPE